MARSAAEMAAILSANPFASAAPNRTVAMFPDHPPPADALADVTGRKDEEIAVGVREIDVHHSGSMGDSKLRIPAAALGTARNMNTIAKLAELAAALS